MPRVRAKEEDIINDLKAFSKAKGGKPISRTEYNNWKLRRFSGRTVFNKFGTWDRACDLAGVPFLKKRQYTELELVEHFEKVWRWRGQRVVGSDLHEYNKIHHTTVHPDAYYDRWGGFANFVKLFAQYKLGQIDFTQLVNAKKKRNEREKISPRLRAQILNRDNYTCKDCGASQRKDPNVTLHIHHIKPASKGGKTEPDNLITNCDVCNFGKSDKIISK
jgi:hypothetical protein